jgi:hypothetical protein
MDISRLWLGYAARLSQFGSQFAGPQSQTHALAANHSCKMRHDGQNVRLKKTGMDPKAARSMCMPVEMAFPVLGQWIMTVPIQFSLTVQAPASLAA